MLKKSLETNDLKYNDIIFSRYIISKIGLFKNANKILNIYKEYLMIENPDGKDLEILHFENIYNIQLTEGYSNEFKIIYVNNKRVETVHTYVSNLRSNILTDIFKQMVNNLY